jgi:hypothetical protein
MMKRIPPGLKYSLRKVISLREMSSLSRKHKDAFFIPEYIARLFKQIYFSQDPFDSNAEDLHHYGAYILIMLVDLVYEGVADLRNDIFKTYWNVLVVNPSDEGDKEALSKKMLRF